MTPDLSALYQEVIIDHNRHPRRFGRLDCPTHHAEGLNPLCGDEITLDLMIAEDRIIDVKFQGQGCAISTASASLMVTQVLDKTTAEAMILFHAFHDAMLNDVCPNSDILGKLSVLMGVKTYPARIKCATLAWHTFAAALQQHAEPITTESEDE